MSTLQYCTYQEKKYQDYESLCKRCGECCGSQDGDPCVNLSKASMGKFYCRIYENRFGPQKTVKGKVFNCVPIREIIKQGYLRQGCAYKRYLEGVGSYDSSFK